MRSRHICCIPLPLNGEKTAEVKVLPIGPRHFRLAPWPFEESDRPSRFLRGMWKARRLPIRRTLKAAFHAAPVEQLTVKLSM